MTRRHAIFAAFTALLPLLAIGCDSMGGAIDKSPDNWSAYANEKVTVRGSAGNSRLGPIVRFDDQGYIALRSSIPWTIVAIGRPVEVKGRIVSGAGFRAEPWVLEPDPDGVKLIPNPPDETRPAPTATP